jgi:hypothetical protein
VSPGAGGLFNAYKNFVYDFVMTGSSAADGLYAASGSPEFYFNSVYNANGFYQAGSMGGSSEEQHLSG